MNPTDAIVRSLGSWQTQGAGPHTHTAPAQPGWQTTVTAESNDSMATRATEVTVARTGPAPAGGSVREWAESIAAKPAGLPEKLAIHEIDTDSGVAVLRSAEPTRKGDSVGYYEATLTGTDEAKLRRYTANTADRTPREPAPFVLTHETIAKVTEAWTE